MFRIQAMHYIYVDDRCQECQSRHDAAVAEWHRRDNERRERFMEDERHRQIRELYEAGEYYQPGGR